MSVSTNAVLKPDPAATESFGLIVIRLDLDDYDYPATLPPEEAGTSIETGFDTDHRVAVLTYRY